MATTPTVRFKLNVKKPQARAFRSFLETIPYVEVTAEEPTSEAVRSRNTFVKGSYAPGETPADFAGVWSNGPERTLEDIRKKAWPTRR